MLIYVVYVLNKEFMVIVGIWVWILYVRVFWWVWNVNRVVRKFSFLDEFWILNGEWYCVMKVNVNVDSFNWFILGLIRFLYNDYCVLKFMNLVCYKVEVLF